MGKKIGKSLKPGKKGKLPKKKAKKAKTPKPKPKDNRRYSMSSQRRFKLTSAKKLILTKDEKKKKKASKLVVPKGMHVQVIHSKIPKLSKKMAKKNSKTKTFE